jgi:ABC-type dipeptide/oligopeptide/nickel transport system permease subunit
MSVTAVDAPARRPAAVHGKSCARTAPRWSGRWSWPSSSLIAVLAPILPIPDPAATDWGKIRLAPSAQHWLGTDEIGRDILSRMIWGARASLLAGVVSVAIAVLIGVPFG